MVKKQSQRNGKKDLYVFASCLGINENDKCIYYKSNDGANVILCLYVDDL